MIKIPSYQMLVRDPPDELTDLTDIRVNKTGLFLRCDDSEYQSIQDNTYPFNAVTGAQMPFPPGVLNPGFPKTVKVEDGLYSLTVLSDSAQASYPLLNKTGVPSMTNYRFVIVVAGQLNATPHVPMVQIRNSTPAPANLLQINWTGTTKILALQSTGTVLQSVNYTRSAYTNDTPFGLVWQIDTSANTRTALWYDSVNGWSTIENNIALTSGDMNLFNSVSASYNYAINGRYYGLLVGAAPAVANVSDTWANWKSDGMWMVEQWIAGNKVVAPSVRR